jgi:hypothetical protein
VVCRCWLRSCASGSGSLAFTASSSTLPVAGRVLGVFPSAPGRPPLRGDATASRGLPVLQSSRSVPDPRVLLSWDSSASPLYRLGSERPLPVRRCRLSFGRSLPGDPSCSASAVSHRPDGLLRSYFAGLLRPAAGSRFTAFQPLVLRSRRPGRVWSSPRCVLPLEGFSSSVAVPHHCGRCPPAVLRSLVSSTRVSRRVRPDARSDRGGSGDESPYPSLRVRNEFRSLVEQRFLRSLRRSGRPVLRAGRDRVGRASALFRPCLELPPSSSFRGGSARVCVWSSQTTGSAHLARPCRGRGSWGCDPAPLVVDLCRPLFERARSTRAPQAGVPSSPGRSPCPCGWVGWSRPGSVSSWAGGSTNTLVSLGFVLGDSWGWGAGTCPGSISSACIFPCGTNAKGWSRISLLRNSCELFRSAPLGFPLEARVLRSGVGGAIARSFAVEYEVGPFPAGCLVPGRIDSRAFIHRRVRSVRFHCWNSNALSFHGLLSPSRSSLHRRVGGSGPVPDVSIRSFPSSPSSSLSGSTRDAESRARCRAGRLRVCPVGELRRCRISRRFVAFAAHRLEGVPSALTSMGFVTSKIAPRSVSSVGHRLPG